MRTPINTPATRPNPETAAAVERLAPRLRRLALAIVGPRRESEAEDLLQQALLRLLVNSPDGVSTDAQRVAWLRTTMIRLWLDRQKSARRRFTRLARLAARLETSPPGHDRPARAEQLDLARAALQRLSPMQRAAFTLRIVEQLDYQAIAETLDTTPAAARSAVHKARRSLRHTLGDEP